MTDLPRNPELYPLSVVIATLGGDSLETTIGYLNRGPAIPAEILICIPDEESPRAERLSFQNVRVVKTPCRGQVAQRAYGLRCVSQPLVLQLDDDIVLQPEALRLLVDLLGQLGHGHAVAPVYRHLSTGRYLAECHRGVRGGLQSLYFSLVCGAPWGIRRMGAISPAGIGYGVDKKQCGHAPFESQWLPGGCVLCHREDLVTEDYYPFTGKAFSEDLIHSVLWRQLGVRLWTLPDAECMTSVAPMPSNWAVMKADMRAHGHVVRLIKGQMWRLYLWFSIFVLKRTVQGTVGRVIAPFKSK
jgi:hypothetical protein